MGLQKSFVLKNVALAEFIEVIGCKGSCIAGTSSHLFHRNALKIFENKKEE
jgi:iron only hydrogenase large subunit-like protein